ncbi:hypothetical protein ACFWHL_05275 [Streptomyces massasporeus]
MAVPAVYAVIIYGSAVLGSVLGNPKNWVGGVLAITMIVAAVHAAILDADWKPGPVTAMTARPCRATEKRA